MSTTRASFVVVVKNDGENLLRTLESLADIRIRQHAEVIVIDGQSTDLASESIQRVERLSDIYLSEADSGIYNAMNKGWKLANGQYVGFINAGDTAITEGLIRLIDATSEGHDVVYGWTSIVDTHGAVRRRFICDHRNLPNGTIPHPGTLAKKTVYEALNGFNETFRVAGDRDFFIRAMKAGYNMRFVDAPTARMVEGGISCSGIVDRENLRIDLSYSDDRRPFVLAQYAVYRTKKLVRGILMSQRHQPILPNGPKAKTEMSPSKPTR